LQIFVISTFLAACAAPKMATPPPPIAAPFEVPAPLPVQCQDKRDPKSVLPKFSDIPPDDYEANGRAGRAIIDLLTADLLAADKQIESCTGK
jgi:hypothetical protein